MTNKEIITNDIKVPNKDMEMLRKHFSHCFDKNGDFIIEKFKQTISENEISFSKESYSMNWLGKSYARLLASDPARTLLKEDKEHNRKPENKESANLLLKGDNLEVLKHLTNAYYEKIKMIYIDPPYNTGDDGFVYQDDRKFTVDELQDLAGIDKERAQRILDFTQSKSNSHSAWLTFMYPRLYIAKQLLREDGVIFISIDDNEVAQLKLMMDEIFGEENFVNKFIWKNGRTSSSIYTQEQEYILAYGKRVDKIELIKYKGDDSLIIERANKKISIKNPACEITFPKGIRFDSEDKVFPGQYGVSEKIKVTSGTMVCKNKKLNEDVTLKAGWVMKNMIEDWINGKEVYDTKGQKIKEFFFKDNGVLQYVKERGTVHPKTIIENFTTKKGTGEVEKLFKNKVFDFPKPTGLIKFLLQIINKKDLILDFFAGSGTTGDAVMQLNAEDGGNRNYILVQLPEPIDANKSKAAYDFVTKELKRDPTIFEITRERLVRAAKKINQELDEKNKKIEATIKSLDTELPTEETQEEIKSLKEKIQVNKQIQSHNNFKVFETMPIWEDYHFEAKELDEQLKLFDETKLTEEDIEALLITWKTYDGIALTEDLQEIDLAGYMAYYANDKLYLVDKDFTTESLKALLERIDSDKSFNPTSIIVFGYHFESKNLRELAENLKSYSNKKNIDIDFITRY